jgi:hypothetical protein
MTIPWYGKPDNEKGTQMFRRLGPWYFFYFIFYTTNDSLFTVYKNCKLRTTTERRDNNGTEKGRGKGRERDGR